MRIGLEAPLALRHPLRARSSDYNNAFPGSLRARDRKEERRLIFHAIEKWVMVRAAAKVAAGGGRVAASGGRAGGQLAVACAVWGGKGNLQDALLLK